MILRQLLIFSGRIGAAMKRHTLIFLAGLVLGGPAEARESRGAPVADGYVRPSPAIPQGRNAISVTVFSPTRQSLADINVELLDDVNALIGRGRTNSAGRFTFNGLGNGRFKVRVLPYGTDYLEETHEVVLANVSATQGSGADQQEILIYLRYNERASFGPFAAGPAVVFVQEAPKEAKKLYQQGVEYLREKKEKEGLESLKKALEIFPNYYLALDRLGGEYAMRGASNRSYFEAALILLSKAFEVNPRSTSSAFGLGWTQYHLGMTDQAIETLRQATTLYGKSVDCWIWYGKALKRGAKPEQAEAAFKKADELAKGKSSEAHWQLAGLYSEQKRYKEAADALELFLKVQPKVADAEKIKTLIKQLRDKAAGTK
jgi:tetratricopeptide (TPR) repeat protein